MNKKRFLNAMLAGVLSGGALLSVGLMSKASTAPATLVSATEVATELDLTTIAFSNTPAAGWGAVNVNSDCTGAPIVIGGVTYQKGIGTHAFNDPASTDGDIEYDITTLATQYEFFECKVSLTDSGNNMFRFAVLVDGVEKDFIYWRTNVAPATYNDGGPLTIRCSIKGGQKLTLRVQSTEWGYGNGSCAFVNPRLYNTTGDKVNASEIFERGTGSNGSGWDFITGSAITTYLRPILDKTVDAKEFTSYAPYGWACKAKTGFGVHLKNATYAGYEADKTNDNLFNGFKFDIENRGLRFFNALVGLAGGCAGAYVDGWADGVEIYHSPLITEADPGKIINIAIPEGAKQFQLRVIANNGMANGTVHIAGAQFFKETADLYGRYGIDSVIPDYSYATIRGTGWMGDDLNYQNAQGIATPAEKGLFIHKDFTYEFPMESTAFDTLSGSIAAYSAEPNHTHMNTLKATFTYDGGKTLVQESAQFNYTTSDIPFAFHFNPTGLKTVKLEIVGEKACSASVINHPVLSTSALKPIFDLLQMEKWDGAATRESGNCATDFASAKTLVLALEADDLAMFKTSEDPYIAAGRARYEAWAAAVSEDPYEANTTSAMISGDITSTSTAIIAIVAATSLLAGAILFIKRRKAHR